MTEAQRVLMMGQEVAKLGQQQVELAKTIQMLIRTHRMFTEYVQSQLEELRTHVGLKDATAEEIETAGNQLGTLSSDSIPEQGPTGGI